MNKTIFLCAICNIQSGTCNEDCKFCTQSVRYNANIKRYKQKQISQIIKEAKIAKANKAVGFCLVTSSKKITDDILEFVSNCAYEIKKENIDIKLIACNGLASLEQLKELKKAGINKYNHNLETSKEFYPQVCSTHPWQERYQTCLNIKSADLELCVGGIFGLGESLEDRDSLIRSITSLKPQSIPVNFFHPNDALPLANNIIDTTDAFGIIRQIKQKNLDAKVMVAGGREIVFKDKQYEIFDYGADSIIIGDYLTTDGEATSKELITLQNLGFEFGAL